MESISRNIENQEIKSLKLENFDEEKFKQQTETIQKDKEEDRRQRESRLETLISELNEDGSEKEKNRLNQLHETILSLDISDKNKEWYKTLWEILNKNLDTEKKLELMVKIVHNMDEKISLQYRGGKTEYVSFYCWNRALFFNYIFNNYNDKLNIEESNICLPYGHCMNVIKMWWQFYLVDWWAWCFNQINDYSIEEKWSWKCIKLNKPIESFKGSWTFYPFSSFPYTEKLNKEELELYTSFNLQGYSYFFTNRLYDVAHQYDQNIEDKKWLEKFCNDVLIKKDNPLEWILDDSDPISIDTKENQINLLKKQISKSLSYSENKEKSKNIMSYIGKITEVYPDLWPDNREGENGPLTQFHKIDEDAMKALKIPKEKIYKIKENLLQKIWNAENNSNENISDYIVKQFEKYKFNGYEKILDDSELDLIVKRFIEAVDKKAAQLNKNLKDFLPTYLSSL